MKKVLYISILLFVSTIVQAQIRIPNLKLEQDTIVSESILVVNENEEDDNLTEVVLPDTVYCLRTKKQHGWFSPMKPVDLQTARKSGSYYMFTRRNSAGFWTKMETFNGHGNPEWLGTYPYIMRTDDPLGDADWIEKVKTGCITEMIADPSGKNVVQEREYDKDMNLIYTYSRVPIGKNKFIGSYKDIYGLPAEMRKDTMQTYTYGTLVVITEDQWGNDSVVEYVDAKGLPKNNYDGVGQSIYIYDEKAQQIAFGSGNHEGGFVLDNKGNCGWRIKYDENSGFPSEEICMDQNMQPMRMPSNGSDNSTTGVMRVLFDFDAFGREKERKFVTMEGTPDTNIYGTHRIVSTYDDYGNRLTMTGYDLKGNLAATDESGTSRYVAEYDGKGRLKHIVWYDKDNKLNSNPDYLCRRKEVYGSDDLLDEQLYCEFNEGKEDTVYYYKRTEKSRYERFIDGIIRIDSLDSKGRAIVTAYYNVDGSPLFHRGHGYHKETTEYTEEGKRLCWRIKHFDAEQQLCGLDEDNYPDVLYVYDSLSNTRRVLNYDDKGRLVNTNIQRWDDDGWAVDQSDANAFGVVCRAGGSSAVRHYRANVLYTQRKGKFSTLIGRDEFDEPDYIKSAYGLLYYYQVIKEGQNVYYDENNKVIENFSQFIDDCPKALSIEVTDSLAYTLGIKDNDVILQYGNEYQINPYVDYATFKGEWTIAQVFEANKQKDLLLFRVDPDTKQYGLVVVTLPEGNPSNLGFLVHPIFRTEKQCKRQQEAIDNYCKRCESTGEKCLWRENVSEETKVKTVIIAFPEMYREYRYEPYPERVTDPSIIISYQLPDMNTSWVLGQSVDEFEEVFLKRNNTSPALLLSINCVKDGRTLQNELFTETNIHAHFSEYKVTEAQYQQLEKLVPQAKKSIKEEERNHKKTQVNKKQLYGKWLTRVSVDEVNADMAFDLSKDRTAQIAVDVVYEKVFSDATMTLGMTITLNTCTWDLQGSVLTLDSHSDINIELTKVDITGLDEENREMMIGFIKQYYDENKEELLDENSLEVFKFDNEAFYVKSVTKDEMELNDGNTDMRFVKVK